MSGGDKHGRQQTRRGRNKTPEDIEIDENSVLTDEAMLAANTTGWHEGQLGITSKSEELQQDIKNQSGSL